MSRAIPIRPHQLLTEIDKQIARLRGRALTGTLQPDMVLGLVEKLDQLSQEMSRELVALSRETVVEQLEESIELVGKSPEAMRRRGFP